MYRIKDPVEFTTKQVPRDPENHFSRDMVQNVSIVVRMGAVFMSVHRNLFEGYADPRTTFTAPSIKLLYKVLL